MNRPRLQVALDYSNLEDGIAAAVAVGCAVDIVEAGTIMLLQTGMQATRILRKLFPDKIIVADTKCADAGGTVAKNCKDNGATWMTCICSATLPTIKAALREIDEVQIELYGDWTMEQAVNWRQCGVKHLIYHQSRDALFSGTSWEPSDLKRIQKLIEMGFEISVTGGLNLETLKLFKGMNIGTFIVGRSITESESPGTRAQAFQNKISELWCDS
ncbi:3-keto-L-gulonate-6-phosphate decarboxylase UlaD [Erysipelothrix rhusiopathiae]|uniref:3-hexulose-6-phosphate synthase n=1 Tax=Erysipelothrix rhusiopathiae ATCC 19414 TaxID=525280 RepID=E7FU62_ERYRH|nr:3-keto-L-gulonate-6-phosphate decarboxylase UlaD [Erysipelothrix rhusiopathiae]EFY09469.1 orotidine 5'-phosphate decarboxylase/HUMPS family [Erysipelothrix rhusiopathiae ATCC 19414]MDE8141903.1 3-keto-L-gulonate-6-phosphate decarboxylase UlaD [Erysipelothrix rhusiopathiae]MDE8280733.1 3-keto-L-gulonate-6-phosphate decarboxylase UlaD [Erysipelothrix rhusiopathiae]MDE8333819.1 3-keto-L-gulonate-6-phosphate decarboxylase UlaD [Erysipelothrix rhusiopathiae]VEH84289.1 3-keto-L-gulonate-6-phospha